MTTSSINSDFPVATLEASKTFYDCNKIFIAIGLIAIIGSLLASNYLYAYYGWGYFSFAVCGGGFVLGITSFVCRNYFAKKDSLSSPLIELEENEEPVSENETENDYSPYLWRNEVFEETLHACQEGYDYQDAHIGISSSQMLEKTCPYEDVDPLEGQGAYQTEFSVVDDEILNVLIELSQAGHNPVGLNMANRYQPGGGVDKGYSTQEEILCRRSNHLLGLRTQRYPLSDKGGIYCPHVQVFRENETNEYAWMENPQEVALVAVAAYDLRPGSRDRLELHLPRSGLIGLELYQNELYVNKTKAKIRNSLRVMFQKGHTHIVLGALGCGVYKNPPEMVSGLFLEIFQETEFEGRFEKVIFAIKKEIFQDQAILDAFEGMRAKLSKEEVGEAS